MGNYMAINIKSNMVKRITVTMAINIVKVTWSKG